jgi:hypothetical protein
VQDVSKCELGECGVLLVTLRYNPDKSGSLHPSFYYGMAGRVTAGRGFGVSSSRLVWFRVCRRINVVFSSIMKEKI